MLSFKAYLAEKKSKVLINPKKDDLKEVKKEHGEDCDCMKCEQKRRKEDVNDGPDVQNEAAPLAAVAKVGAVVAKAAKGAAKVGKVAKKAAVVGSAMSSANSNNNNSSTVDEAKVDQGRSDYGKASIRNYRRSGPGHGDPGMFDPEGKRGKTIDKRREEHKARRGVKGAKVPAYKREETEVYWSSKALDQLDAINEKDTALDIVKKKIIAKYGKGAIMRKGSNQQKKVRGAKSTAGTNKYKDMADKKKETAADAKKRGFKDVKSYVNTMARYGGKDNYDKGKGLGT